MNAPASPNRHQVSPRAIPVHSNEWFDKKHVVSKGHFSRTRIVRNAFVTCLLGGALIVLIDVLELAAPNVVHFAHAHQTPSSNDASVAPAADYFPSHYENQAKEIEPLPPQF